MYKVLNASIQHLKELKLLVFHGEIRNFILMIIAENITSLVNNCQNSQLAVSKNKSNEEIMQAYNAGQRVFGENKIQDMTRKFEKLPKDIQWHMIGHVQSNKVKYMAPMWI